MAPSQPQSPPPAGTSGWSWVGPAVALFVVGLLLILYMPLLPLLAHLTGKHLILFTMVIIPMLLVYGIVGRDYGIHRLFWHEFPRRRFVAAISLTLLIVNFVAVAYYTAIRPDDDIAVAHLREGLTGLTSAFRGLFHVDLMKLATWVDGRPVTDFQFERFGRFVVFLLVAVPPPVLVASLPAFFPNLVRLSSRGLPPQQRFAHVVAWFGGIALGLSAGMALVLVGNSVFKARSIGAVPGGIGRPRGEGEAQ